MHPLRWAAACCHLSALCVRSCGLRLRRLHPVYQLCVAAIVGLWVVLPVWQLLDEAAYRNRRACYERSSTAEQFGVDAPPPPLAGVLLPDVLQAGFRGPTVDRTIFIIDTECRSGGAGGGALLELDNRLACVIEAAARSHPDWDIFVLFASPVRTHPPDASTATTLTDARANDDADDIVDVDQYSDHVARLRHHNPNVHLRNVDLWRYAHDTPIAHWMHTDEGRLFAAAAEPGGHQMKADVREYLRWVTLHRFGGTVIEPDVLLRRPLDELGANWAALGATDDDDDAQPRGRLDGAAVNLNRTSDAGQLAAYALHEFQHRFRGGSQWRPLGGRDALNQLVSVVCASSAANDGTDDALLPVGVCSGVDAGHAHFRVLRAATFQAVPPHHWPALFEARQAYYVLERVHGAYGVKLWSRWAGGRRVRRVRRAREPVPVLQLAEQHCPRVYATSGRWF